VPEELLQQPSLGKPGEPCEECGAALAADQRYCLNCGHRRGGPRIDYAAVMAGAAPAQASQQPQPASANGASPPEEPPKRERDYAPLAAVGGIAVLGLMLLIGVLIGKGDSPSSAPSTPSVLRVDPSQAGGEGSGASSSSGSDKNTSSGLAGGKKKKKSESGGGDTGEIEASTNQLEELNSETGEDAAKKALELPNEIATPGEPPPIDKSTPPAGGEKGISIE
jgi:hypothetical protein